jgi:gliding motility-associated-like protein
MVQTRGGSNVKQRACSQIWDDGFTFTKKKPDTLVTAIISKWDTAADVSAVWDQIKDRLVTRGFDPFAISDAQMAKMIWNNKGTIGFPNTGARGCIDTSGFGKLIRFYMRPDPKFTKIINRRDTNIRPTDSVKIKGKWLKAYTFFPQWAGYHLVSISMTSSNGKCDEFAAAPVLVGFAMMLEFPDSIVCQDQANTLAAKPDYRYFNPDPINNGTWDNYDYWRDTKRLLVHVTNPKIGEPFTKWDWNKADDDKTNPQTIFGGTPWGGSGTGTTANPWVQLGGGGSNALYYKNDSGVYTFRNIAGDSTGCFDTITKKVFITRLDARFNLNVSTPSCNSIIEFFDSTSLYDPCSWGIKNCNGPQPTMCDFITRWSIDWGDGKNAFYARNTASEEGLPPRIGHKYTHNGWFKVKYIVSTNQGCNDTISRWIKIPGPRPKFNFTDKAGYEVTICAGDSIRFTNLTDSATTSADWVWIFGDTKVSNVKDSIVTHTYKTPGRFYVTLQQFDSLYIPPNIRKYCSAVFPDTSGGQAAFIVNVLGRDSVRGKLVKQSICPGDSNTFIDFSDTLFKSNKWVFKNLSTGVKDSITRTADTLNWTFTTPGIYEVTHTADYNPNRPRPWCPTNPIILRFLVDSIKADFSIDSSNKPDFCYTRTDVNGVTFRWGFGHKNDIKLGPNKNFIQNTSTSDKKVCTQYDSSGVYWVCFIAKNATGCIDTICKPVVVDLFLYLANVFTPGVIDGKNDTYRVPIQGQDVFELKIFNRWGERMFFSEDPKFQWNGKVMNTGADCPEGTYFYQLRYRFKGKTKVNLISGSINLIR